MEKLMNLPQYELLITHKPFACLGEQLVQILQYIKPFIQDGTWYASDIDTLGDNMKIEHFIDEFPRKVGTIENLINLAKCVNQFQSGIFILIPTDHSEIMNIKYRTEDIRFRDLGDALLEIRALDTSFFVIYSNDLNFINTVSKEFNGVLHYYKDYKTDQQKVEGTH